MAFGVRDLRAGLRQMIVKLPENAQLAQLGQSATDLASAQSELEHGLMRISDGGVFLQSSTQLLLNRMPTQVNLIEGSPEGLAYSVVSELKVVSQVNHLGAAMVPNVIPVAIWLGAGIAVFLIRGRYIALLALQISASGGVVPIELSSEFFSTLSPWLPMTWVVQGLKAAMFSAYAGDWLRPLIQTLALTVICALITMAVGRWQYCRVSRLRPMLGL